MIRSNPRKNYGLSSSNSWKASMTKHRILKSQIKQAWSNQTFMRLNKHDQTKPWKMKINDWHWVVFKNKTKQAWQNEVLWKIMDLYQIIHGRQARCIKCRILKLRIKRAQSNQTFMRLNEHSRIKPRKRNFDENMIFW